MTSRMRWRLFVGGTTIVGLSILAANILGEKFHRESGDMRSLYLFFFVFPTFVLGSLMIIFSTHR